MAKFYGKIGYEVTEETPEGSGIWIPVQTEREHCGDVLNLTRRYEDNQKVNDDISISNRISIVADPFAIEHAHEMKYVRWLGARWKVSSVEIEYPRVILTLGGVYNA